MISELRLLFFVSAIYFLVTHFGMFKQIDGVMKGQDELMILSVKVGSTILILYLLIHFSKQGVVEGVQNGGDIKEFYDKIQQALNREDIIDIAESVEKNAGNIADWVAYGTASDCIQKMDPNKDDIPAAIHCIKLRLVDNAECKINSLDQINECTIVRIMESIHILGDEDRVQGYKTIANEISKDNDIVKKMELAHHLDKLIISIHNGGDYHVWIEYILEIYSDILSDDEIEFLESKKKTF